jgi:hypothetical protein
VGLDFPVGYAMFGVVAFALRSFVHYRRTGSSGIHVMNLQGMERFALALIVPVKIAWLVAPLSVLLGWVSFIPALDYRAIHVMGMQYQLDGGPVQTPQGWPQSNTTRRVLTPSSLPVGYCRS